MNKNLLLFIFFITIISFRASGQEKSANDYDGQKHITGTDYSYYKKKRVRESTEAKPQANVVKTSLTSWLSGCIPVYYERRVTPWLGLQGGLGITTRDFMANLRDDIYYIYSTNPVAYNNYAFYSTQGRKTALGVYVSFQPKFYPRKNALGGFFVSPMLEYKRFDYTAEYTDQSITSDESQPTYVAKTMPEYRNTVDFTVNVGWQWLFQSKVSLELMMGAGFRKLWEQRRVINQTNVYNPVSGYNDGYIYTTNALWSTSYRPEFNLTLNIGGYF